MTDIAERPGCTPFRFDRSWVFRVEPAEFWATVTRTGEFQRWWPWLRRLDAPDLVAGARADCVVRAPIPYTLRFTVILEEVVPERLVDASVVGDLRGPARLEVAGHPEGTEARLAWRMELRKPLLRRAARVARPVMEWGHDWVVGTGVDQFQRRALRV